jgi:hypothetical protein
MLLFNTEKFCCIAHETHEIGHVLPSIPARFANNPGLCGPQIHVACHLVPKTTTPENATAPVSVPDLPALAGIRCRFL